MDPLTARQLRRTHLALAGLWAVLIIPTVLLWADSVLWIGLVSCYANAVGHWAGYDAARAEDS